MVDSLGHRLKIGVIVPSVNTTVQPEFASMQVAGVTNHLSRIAIPNAKLGSDEDFIAHVERMRSGIGEAMARVMTCGPGYVINALSLEAFWEGLDGSRRMLADLEKEFSIGISMGSNAILAALEAIGGIRTIALITPHKPLGDERVRRYFTEAGYEISALKSFNIILPDQIPHVSKDELRAAIIEVAASKPDAVVQVGTGLAMAALAPVAEAWLKIPVIAINTACYWHALRQNGIADRFEGFGRLFTEL